MLITLENEIEKEVWKIMLAAHYKRDQMEGHFFDLYKEETDQIIAKETTRRLFEDYGPNGLDVMGASEKMYVSVGLLNNRDWLEDVSEEDFQEFKTELAEEYQTIMENFKRDELNIEDEVRKELSNLYYQILNIPDLPVRVKMTPFIMRINGKEFDIRGKHSEE